MKTKSIFPWERSVVDTLHILFLYVSEGKLMDCVRLNFQCPASASPFSSSVFFQFDPGFLDNRFRQFNTGAHETRINEQKRRGECLHATPAHHEVVAGHPDRNNNSLP